MKKIGFDLRQMQMLVAVGKTLSFSTAAQQLQVSQAAISQNIAKLEEHYGVILIKRQSRPVSLTDAGVKLMRLAEQWLLDAVHMQTVLQFSHSSKLKKLHIGVIDSITSVLAPFIVENFSDRADFLSLQSGVISSLNSAFEDGQLDMLVTTNIDIGASAEHSVLLVDDPYVLIAPSQYAQLTFNEMVGQLNYIGYDKRSQIGQRVQAIFEQHDIKVSNTLHVDSFDTLSKLVSSGVGWGLISAYSLQGITGLSQHLVVRNVLESRYFRQIHLIGNCSLPQDLIETTAAMFRGFLMETVRKKIQEHFPLIVF